jgi:hypothetical protein
MGQDMHLRRALLLFAVILGSLAIVASLTPMPDRRTNEEPVAPSELDIPPGERVNKEILQRRFDVDRPPKGDPPVRRVALGRHVVVTVVARRPGDVEIQGLGQIRSAEPGTPAVFDLLLDRPGRFGLVFDPVNGKPFRAGALNVRSDV